jgi:hypothetical protein
MQGSACAAAEWMAPETVGRAGPGPARFCAGQWAEDQDKGWVTGLRGVSVRHAIRINAQLANPHGSLRDFECDNKLRISAATAGPKN